MKYKWRWFFTSIITQTLLCIIYSTEWYSFSNGYHVVAQEEGNDVDDPASDMTLEDCQSKCDENRLCHSIAWCDGGECYVKDKKLTKTALTRRVGYCSTYYKNSRGNKI